MATITTDIRRRAESPDGRRYTGAAQLLHWLTPPLVLAQVAVAWVMLSLPAANLQDARMFALHKSIGITVWLLIALRLTWRLTHPALKAGPEMPHGLDMAGRATHWLMYLVLFAMPISGYVSSAMGPHGVAFWGLPLPSLPHVDAVAKAAGVGHVVASYALYALVTLHVAATAYHVAVRRDGCSSACCRRRRTPTRRRRSRLRADRAERAAAAAPP